MQMYLRLDKATYKNQYVVLVEGKVVAKGEHIEKLLRRVQKSYPREVPFVAKVPGDEVLVRKPLIPERLKIQSDPFLHASPQAKSRLVDEWSAMMLRAKLAFLKQQNPSASTREIYKQLSSFLDRLTQREQLIRRTHG